nr:hydrogen gas-evolving membrane-bound hydrogenase subunit E [Candidatus Krumholzibacteria bacterium]
MQTLLLTHLIAALAAPLLVKHVRRAAPWILGAVPGMTAAGLLFSWVQGGHQVLEARWDWLPQLGVEVALRADGLSLLFVALVGLIGGLVVLHAGHYLATSPRLGRFFFLIFLFLTAMFGLVLADNLWLLFICWELTSITSYFLIGFKHDQSYARDAARRALLTTGAGGLALLGGFAVLVTMGRQAGLDLGQASTISVLLQHGDTLRADPLYLWALGLILAGAFTKSAQIPFHHWLPAAMAGPTPVSALLHSATMVKAGVFLLARLFPVLGGTPTWTITLTLVGAVTMTGGALMAIGRKDLKEILAFTTISALGTLILLLGVGTGPALAAMVVFLTVHALYKASLFLVVANLDQRTGSRDMTVLGGWGKVMPLTAVAALLAALGQAGAPPALGYMGKKLALLAKMSLPAVGEWMTLAAVITNVAMVALALAIAVRPFWSRSEKEQPADRGPVPLGMELGPLVLALLGVAIGLVPSVFDTHLGTAAASAAAGYPVPIKLKVWSGLNVESLLLIGLSLAVFAVGYLSYRKLHLFQKRPTVAAPLTPWTPTVLYDRGLNGMLAGAARLTGFLQNGRLRTYVGIVSLATAALALPWLIKATRSDGWSLGTVHAHEILLVTIMAAGAIGGAFAGRPIVAALAVGMTGLGLALVFALFSGVDLAITQLLVETLLVVILVAVLVRLPRQTHQPSKLGRVRDLAIALTVGATATLAVLLTAAGDRSRDLADTLLAWSLPEAAGRNVVNVILVDFRAMDTLGEVVVVAAAALTVGALLAACRKETS